MPNTGRLINRRKFVWNTAVAAGTLALPALSGCNAVGNVISSSESGNAQQSLSQGDPKPDELLPNDTVSPFSTARLLLLGDTHTAADFGASIAHTRAAFAAVGQFDPAPDAIILNGDVVNHGLHEEYDLLETLAAEVGLSFPEDFIVTMGDHEQWGLISQGAEADYPGQREIFLQRVERNRLYYDASVNGEHLIVLGPDVDPQGWATLAFSEQQLSWLDALLAEDLARGVRSFVFTHAPANDTVPYTFAGEQKHGSLETSAAFLDIVSKYPQAMVVSSHTHSLPGFSRPVDDGPLFVSTGAVAYLRPDAHAEWSEEGLAFSHGLLLDIYRDRVEFTPWDFVLQEPDEESYVAR